VKPVIFREIAKSVTETEMCQYQQPEEDERSFQFALMHQNQHQLDIRSFCRAETAGFELMMTKCEFAKQSG
jgi:hypothetical protein